MLFPYNYSSLMIVALQIPDHLNRTHLHRIEDLECSFDEAATVSPAVMIVYKMVNGNLP